jgi:hypothetical protein
MPTPTTTAPKKASSALPIKVIKEQKIVVKKQKPEVVVPHKHEKSPHAMFASPMSIVHVSPMAPMDHSSKLKQFGYFVLGLVIFAFIASFLLMQTRQFLVIVFVLFYMVSDMYFQVSHRKDVLLLRLIFLLWIVAILVLKKNKPLLVKKHAYLLYYYGPILVLFLNIFLKSSSKMLM